jgi:hypothetical protein
MFAAMRFARERPLRADDLFEMEDQVWRVLHREDRPSGIVLLTLQGAGGAELEAGVPHGLCNARFFARTNTRKLRRPAA